VGGTRSHQVPFVLITKVVLAALERVYREPTTRPKADGGDRQKSANNGHRIASAKVGTIHRTDQTLRFWRLNQRGAYNAQRLFVGVGGEKRRYGGRQVS
jgi:hypothetical protein